MPQDVSPTLVVVNTVTAVAFIGLAGFANYCLQLRDDTALFQRRLRNARASKHRAASYAAALSGLDSRGLGGGPDDNSHHQAQPPSSHNYHYLDAATMENHRTRTSSHRVNTSFYAAPTSEELAYVDPAHFSGSDTESVVSRETEVIVQEQRNRDESKPLIEDGPISSGTIRSDTFSQNGTPTHRKRSSALSAEKLDQHNNGLSLLCAPFWFCCCAPHFNDDHPLRRNRKSMINTEMFSDDRTIYFFLVMISCIVQAVTVILFTLSVDLAQYANRKEQDLVTSPQAATVFAVFIVLLVVLHSLVRQELQSDQVENIRRQSRLIMLACTLFIAVVYVIVELLEAVDVLSPEDGEFTGSCFSGMIASLFLYSAYSLPKQLEQFGSQRLEATSSRFRGVCILIGVWLLIRLVVYFPYLQDMYSSLQAYPPAVFDFIDMFAIGMSLAVLHRR